MLEFSAAAVVAITDHYYQFKSQLESSDDTTYKNLPGIYNKLHRLLEQVDIVVQENTVLCEVHEASRKEIAALQATVDILIYKLDEHTAISAPPLPEIMASSTTIEEMTI
jgi:hypothetical protein